MIQLRRWPNRSSPKVDNPTATNASVHGEIGTLATGGNTVIVNSDCPNMGKGKGDPPTGAVIVPAAQPMNVYGPAVVGVPVIAPVTLSRVNPGGNDPWMP